MSNILDKITNLQNIRNRMKEKLVSLNLVDSAAKFESIATAVESIVDNGAVTSEVKEGESFTIPAGWHNGSGKVLGVAGGGNYKLEDVKSVTPTKAQQNIAPSQGFYGLMGVTVAPIPGEYQDVSDVTATAADVLANRIFVDSEGVVTPGNIPVIGAATGKINGLETSTYTIPEGYHDGTGTVELTKDIEEALAAL